MKKIAVSTVLLIVLLLTQVVYALETTTYNFVASNIDTIIPITTYRDGTIVASAVFKPSNHGLYNMQIFDAVGHILCYETYDFRWGRSPSMPMICNTNEYASQYYSGGILPLGSYRLTFRASMGGKVIVTLNITAETNQ